MEKEDKQYTLGFLSLLHKTKMNEVDLINHSLAVLEKIYEFQEKGWTVGFLRDDGKMFREMKFVDME